jgi:hypothetical protein
MSYFNVVDSKQEDKSYTICIQRPETVPDNRAVINVSLDKQRNRIIVAEALAEVIFIPHS